MTHIEQLHLDGINDSKFESSYSPIPQIEENMAAKNSADITEQIACEFAEWLDDTLDKDFVKELFQKYLKSKENETTTNTH